MEFSVSIGAVFNKKEWSVEQKITKVQELGFPAFEFWGWWNEDLEAIEQALNSTSLQLASMCTKFISLVDPKQRESYITGLQESIAVAKRLNCKYLISQTGDFIPGVPREEQEQSLIEGLRVSVPYLEQAGITLVVEPLNTRVDHPGYFLEHSEEAFRVIKQVNSPNVKVLFDIYHQQITEGNLIPNMMNNLDDIGYFHIADHPGRHEIGTGEIHYDNVLQAIKQTGYDGYVGLEYFPKIDAVQSLQHFKEQYFK